MQNKVVAIIQARTSSKRFPSKIFMPLNNTPMIIYQLNRIKKAKTIDDLILATSNDKSDDFLSRIVAEEGYKVFRGDLKDVLSRFYKCAEKEKAKTIVRLTGDNPLIDPVLIDEIVEEYLSSNYDYLSNAIDENKLSVPDGFDIEVFDFDLLSNAFKKATLESEREHVTPWMRKDNKGLYKYSHYMHKPFRKYYRLTVDEYPDFQLISTVVSELHSKFDNFGIDEIIDFLKANPNLAKINMLTKRNEGYLKSIETDNKKISIHRNQNKYIKGKGLWEKAKKIIPGGNMLLSKRPEMFLPNNWPSYYSRTDGCFVWDLDGRKLADFSIMGIGTNLLGYSNPEVDAAVISTVNSGNMSTLNCPEEVLLAEKLVAMHPWSDMAKFARSGGEANSIAIRIARAATGKETIAICGYHGWHDWYLATNLKDESSLATHLLPGLIPNGVPSGLKDTVKPFKYNSLEELIEISDNFELAAVKMEVERTFPPKKGFLEGVRKLCNKKGIPLIFDECTSGFRETYGGLHKKYNIEPDMAMFGKALGNGYAITAVIGKEELMQAAQSTFISSTFWTERIGPTAALKTLEVMEREKSWEKVSQTGKKIKKQWHELGKNNNLKINLFNIDALPSYSIDSKNWLKYKTFITQEMLKKGFLATNSCYVCTQHNENLLNNYFDNLNNIFHKINKCEEGYPIEKLLEGPVCHDTFKRLN